MATRRPSSETWMCPRSPSKGVPGGWGGTTSPPVTWNFSITVGPVVWPDVGERISSVAELVGRCANWGCDSVGTVMVMPPIEPATVVVDAEAGGGGIDAVTRDPVGLTR